MRILVFHGYLLRGTGSNVYNARLAAALARGGVTVDLVCQERRPRELPFVDAIGTWVDGEPRVEVLREPVRVTAWRPDIGTLLPTYVVDRYEGFDAKSFLDCTDEEVAAYAERNVAAIRDVVARARPDVALANHLVMGPVVLARGLDPDVPYAVKVHGSALEYTVKRDPARFLPFAREGLARARTVLVGSRHTAESLWAAMDDAALPDRTRLGPPGVDIAEFRPRPRAEAAAGVEALAARLAAAATVEEDHAFARDEAAVGRALATLDLASGRDRHVAFVGKLIVSKGIDLLATAWPLVLRDVPDARLVVVGFGGWRDGLERLLAALAAGDLDAARAVAEAGRALEGGPRAPLRHLLAFLERVGDPYLRAAARLPETVAWSGRLEHAELADLLPACAAQVVPSTFPEAFGMVAAEAAACGVLPISAGHSGLAEVSRTLAAAVPREVASLLSFVVDDVAVEGIAERIVRWLDTDETVRARTRTALVGTAQAHFSWVGVAQRVISAAQGRLSDLPPVA